MKPITSENVELSVKQQINKAIQDGVLSIIDSLKTNDLPIANELYEYVNREHLRRYDDNTTTLILLNTLVQTVDYDCRVIDTNNLTNEKDNNEK